LTQAFDPTALVPTRAARAARRVLLVGEPPDWRPGPAPLGHAAEPLDLVAVALHEADAALAAEPFEAAVVNLSRDARRRLDAVARWRQAHPRIAWLALVGPEPILAEEVLLRAGILEAIDDAEMGHGLSRAVSRALARQAAWQRPAEPASDPPAWESSHLQATRLSSLGAMAAGVAHEINNPLAYVRSNLEYVLEEFSDLADRFGRLVRRFPNVAGGATGFPDVESRLRELRSAMDEANEGVTRVTDVVGGLKHFSIRPRLGTQAVDLAAVARSSLRMVARTVEERARLVARLGATPKVHGNEAYLGQVVLNLVVNAAQAIPEGQADVHRVAVSTFTSDDGAAVLEVSDTGAGMSEQVARRIFEPFFTTKDAGQGTGLGLSVTRRVVDAFGGTIAVESAPGEGTTFRITFPPVEGDAPNH
jgi:signal transduction histidine kinase